MAAGPEVVRDFLYESCGVEDINALWQAGPEAVREVLTRSGIDQFELDDGEPISVNDWLNCNPRMRLIDEFHQAGISEVNGVAIEDFIVDANDYHDFIDITHGRLPRSQIDPMRPTKSSFAKYYNKKRSIIEDKPMPERKPTTKRSAERDRTSREVASHRLLRRV